MERIESLAVVVVTQLPGTNRGSEGFGSTWMAVLEAGGRVVVTPLVSSDGPDPSDMQSLVPPEPPLEEDDVLPVGKPSRGLERALFLFRAFGEILSGCPGR